MKDDAADLRYDHALAAGLVIVEAYASSPGAPQHELLSLVVFAVLHAIEQYEVARTRVDMLCPSSN